jgi:hypothetical protein
MRKEINLLVICNVKKVTQLCKATQYESVDIASCNKEDVIGYHELKDHKNFLFS